MKRSSIAAALFIFITVFAVKAHADLDSFLSNLNVEAKADISGYSVKLSTQFGVPLPQVEAVIKSVDNSADAFMCLQLSQMTNKHPDAVLQIYKSNRGKGWGVIAKELGIKPGSAEFHALKSGEFNFTGQPGGGAEKGHGKGKGKGHNK